MLVFGFLVVFMVDRIGAETCDNTDEFKTSDFDYSKCFCRRSFIPTS